ncbi:F-box protein At3g07870-like [Papaver somniferum]|uniref:F-box protein At3g07870-like n=1 Tax=Papaver somniferum TaxID=3469 RepID=UPI000E6F98F4|nr:F-box protein At3g07870-like [Papaver somniferum]
MTGEYIYLPEMDFGGISRDNMYSGFGYCISTNEYKVVQVYYGNNVGSLPLGKVQVYTLGGGNMWRHKGEIPYIFKEGAVYANNSLYWIDHSTELQFNNIIAFDLADETFSILPLPPCFDSVPGYYPEKRVYLVSLRGSLGVYHVNIGELSSEHALSTNDCLDIWILKKEKELQEE